MTLITLSLFLSTLVLKISRNSLVGLLHFSIAFKFLDSPESKRSCSLLFFAWKTMQGLDTRYRYPGRAPVQSLDERRCWLRIRIILLSGFDGSRYPNSPMYY